LSNLLRHVIEDKDDLSAGKKSARVRKTMMALEDDDERRQRGVRGR
jgi:hypothetical protein